MVLKGIGNRFADCNDRSRLIADGRREQCCRPRLVIPGGESTTMKIIAGTDECLFCNKGTTIA